MFDLLGDGRVRRLARGLAWLVVIIAIGVGTAAVVVPRLAGATPYTVLTGSMRPVLDPGDLVVVRPVRPEKIATGTVVTYQLHSGEPEVVTHRVIALGFDGDGERVFQTQGDANDAPDPAWVRPVQIRGEVWYSIPYLGYAVGVLTPAQRELATRVVGVLLLLYAGSLLLRAIRDRFGQRPKEAVDA